jgi:hypothetical protein
MLFLLDKRQSARFSRVIPVHLPEGSTGSLGPNIRITGQEQGH